LAKKTVANLGEEYVAVNGVKIRYVAKGDGPPVLLIHGFGQFLEVWWFNIGPLSQHYRVISDQLQALNVPTLLVHGAKDPVVPLEYARNAYQLIPGSRLEIINECGHCPHLEKASEFNRAVISFLGS